MILKARNVLEPYYHNDRLFIGFGGLFKNGTVKRIGMVDIPYDILKAHVGIYGATRSGKTVLLRSILKQIIMKCWGLIFIDFKPDAELFQTVFNSVLQAGRERDFVFFSPLLSSVRQTLGGSPFPNSSGTWNPLLEGGQSEIVSRIMNAFKRTGRSENFYEDVKEDAVDALVGSLMGMGKRFNFRDMYIALSDLEAMSYVIENTKNVGARTKLENIRRFFVENPQKAEYTYKGTVIALSKLATGEVAPYLNSYDPSISVRDVLREGKILYVALSYQKASTVSEYIAKMLIAEVNSVIGDTALREGKLPSRSFLVVDEFENCVFEGVNDLFNKSAGIGLTLIVAHQTIADIAYRMGKEFLEILLANMQTKIMLKQTSTEGASHLERVVPLTWKMTRKVEEFSILNMLFPFELNRSYEERPLVESRYLTNLPELNFYAKVGETVYRGIVPILLPPRKTPEVSWYYDPSTEDRSAGLNLFERFAEG